MNMIYCKHQNKRGDICTPGTCTVHQTIMPKLLMYENEDRLKLQGQIIDFNLICHDLI